MKEALLYFYDFCLPAFGLVSCSVTRCCLYSLSPTETPRSRPPLPFPLLAGQPIMTQTTILGSWESLVVNSYLYSVSLLSLSFSFISVPDHQSGSSSLRDSGTSLHPPSLPPCSNSLQPAASPSPVPPGSSTSHTEDLISEIKRLRDR